MSKKPVVLVIMDGQGNGDHKKGDAVFNAKTPNLDAIRKEFGSIEMITYGEQVGLPKGQMGNSEVGHTNIGAGRVVRQGLSKINHSMFEAKDFDKNEVMLKAIKHAKDNKGNLQLFGLASPGGVHSSMAHIYPIVDLANKNGVKVYIHAFTDGRDVSPTSGPQYMKELIDGLKGKDATIASVHGRYYAMDRDTR
jgi:2,3-bisphosphoglycerate-independent phosphoglycerate mutase